MSTNQAIMPENGVNLEFIVILKNKDDIQKIEWNDKVENTLKKVFKKTKASALHRGVGVIKFTDNNTKLERWEIDVAIKRLKKYRKGTKKF